MNIQFLVISVQWARNQGYKMPDRCFKAALLLAGWPRQFTNVPFWKNCCFCWCRLEKALKWTRSVNGTDRLRKYLPEPNIISETILMAHRGESKLVSFIAVVVSRMSCSATVQWWENDWAVPLYLQLEHVQCACTIGYNFEFLKCDPFWPPDVRWNVWCVWKPNGFRFHWTLCFRTSASGEQQHWSLWVQ